MPDGSRGLRLAALTAGLSGLYLAQGVVTGATETMVGLLARDGVQLAAQTGLLAWAALPWVLKLGWGLAWDFFAPPRSSRRDLILFGVQLAVAACVYGLGRPDGSGGLPLVFFALNTFASMQDVGTDAYAVDAIPKQRRALVNAFMAAARAVGATVIGASVFLGWFAAHGSSGAANRAALVCAALAFCVVGLRVWPKSDAAGPESGEAPAANSSSAEVPPGSRWEAMASLVTRRESRFALLLTALIFAGDGLTSAVSFDFLLKAAHWTLEDLVGRLRPVGAISGLVGFALAAALVDRLGHLRGLASGALLLSFGWGTMALASGLWTSPSTVLTLAVVEGLGQSLVVVSAYAFLMGVAVPRVRATHFVVYMTVLNLPRVLGPLAAPSLFEHGGYAGVWFAAASLEIALVVLAGWGWRRGYGRTAPK